jgi:MFS family permease
VTSRRPTLQRGKGDSGISRRQRLTLVVAILGSAVSTIDGTIVNVALPAIARDLGGGLVSQQWVSNAYLSLAARA